MPAFLITQRGPEIGRRYELTELQFTIGRGQDNDLVLPDALVSRYHAVIRRDGEDLVIIDLGSTNPLVVNETVPEPGMPYRLQHRDVVTIGQSVFSFQNPPRAQQAVVPPSAAEPRTMVGSAEQVAARNAPPIAPAAPARPATPPSAPAAAGPAPSAGAARKASAPQTEVRPVAPAPEPETVVSRREPPSEPPAPPEPAPLGEQPTVIVRRPGREPAGAPPSSNDEPTRHTPGGRPEA